MAKTKISEYSSTSAGANLNTDINTIDIDEGCAPSGINNAIRTLMAQLKDFQTGVSGDSLTLGGALSGTSATFSGNVTASAISGASLTLSGNVTASAISGASLTLSGNITASAISGASMTLSGDLTVDTNTLYVDATNNRVGIGTSSPARALEVKQSGDSFISITAGNANSSVLELGDSDDINIGRILYNHGSNYLATYTDNTERMRIDSSGNVLVGTTTARGTITVNGSVSPVAAPSSIWGIDFGTSTSNGNYITIANNATYALSGGAGCVWIYEQSSSVGLCMVNFAYGGSYIVSNPQNNYSNTVNTASKTNIYYDSGTGKYTIQNKSGATYSYWIATMKIRATS